jgi:redox-sensitive bicupin YhaK (pirin superfamily)
MKTENVSPATTATPLIVKRPANARGLTEIDWLYSRHTFSFGEYYDPAHMGFRSLRVINDDIVQPGQGFGTHPHRDAEIFTYVIEGELEHRDSMGNGSIIKARDLQYMSAGSGVRHSEFNPSKTNRVHLLQIWLLPNTMGGEPRYAEKHLGSDAKPNSLTLLFAGEPRADAIEIRQDAEISFGKLDSGKTLSVELGPKRHAWLQLIKGELRVLNETLQPGDGAGISNATDLEITATQDAEFLFFNLP